LEINSILTFLLGYMILYLRDNKLQYNSTQELKRHGREHTLIPFILYIALFEQNKD